MINQDKPSTSLVNTDRIQIGETWASIPTTWASEVRQWQELQSLITNSTRISSSMTNAVKP